MNISDIIDYISGRDLSKAAEVESHTSQQDQSSLSQTGHLRLVRIGLLGIVHSCRCGSQNPAYEGRDRIGQ